MTSLLRRRSPRFGVRSAGCVERAACLSRPSRGEVTRRLRDVNVFRRVNYADLEAGGQERSPCTYSPPMARVTVEDCLEKVPNRFALTVLASRRARALSEQRGTAMVECENKEGVTALREVAAEKVRYEEDVETVVRDFIEEQRTQLRSTSNDNTFLEAVPLSMGDDDEDEDVAASPKEVGEESPTDAAEESAIDAEADGDSDSEGDSEDEANGVELNIDDVADVDDDDDDDD